MKKLIIGILFVGLLSGCLSSQYSPTTEESLKYIEKEHPDADILDIKRNLGGGYTVKFRDGYEYKTYIFSDDGGVWLPDGLSSELIGNWTTQIQ